MVQVAPPPASARAAIARARHPAFWGCLDQATHCCQRPGAAGGGDAGRVSFDRSADVCYFQMAYAPPSQRGVLRGDLIAGTPGWLSEERYDIFPAAAMTALEQKPGRLSPGAALGTVSATSAEEMK